MYGVLVLTVLLIGSCTQRGLTEESEHGQKNEQLNQKRQLWNNHSQQEQQQQQLNQKEPPQIDQQNQQQQQQHLQQQQQQQQLQQLNQQNQQRQEHNDLQNEHQQQKKLLQQQQQQPHLQQEEKLQQNQRKPQLQEDNSNKSNVEPETQPEPEATMICAVPESTRHFALCKISITYFQDPNRIQSDTIASLSAPSIDNKTFRVASRLIQSVSIRIDPFSPEIQLHVAEVTCQNAGSYVCDVVQLPSLEEGKRGGEGKEGGGEGGGRRWKFGGGEECRKSLVTSGDAGPQSLQQTSGSLVLYHSKIHLETVPGPVDLDVKESPKDPRMLIINCSVSTSLEVVWRWETHYSDGRDWEEVPPPGNSTIISGKNRPGNSACWYHFSSMTSEAMIYKGDKVIRVLTGVRCYVIAQSLSYLDHAGYLNISSVVPLIIQSKDGKGTVISHWVFGLCVSIGVIFVAVVMLLLLMKMQPQGNLRRLRGRPRSIRRRPTTLAVSGEGDKGTTSNTHRNIVISMPLSLPRTQVEGDYHSFTPHSTGNKSRRSHSAGSTTHLRMETENRARRHHHPSRSSQPPPIRESGHERREEKTKEELGEHSNLTRLGESQHPGAQDSQASGRAVEGLGIVDGQGAGLKTKQAKEREGAGEDASSDRKRKRAVTWDYSQDGRGEQGERKRSSMEENPSSCGQDQLRHSTNTLHYLDQVIREISAEAQHATERIMSTHRSALQYSQGEDPPHSQASSSEDTLSAGIPCRKIPLPVHSKASLLRLKLSESIKASTRDQQGAFTSSRKRSARSALTGQSALPRFTSPPKMKASPSVIGAISNQSPVAPNSNKSSINTVMPTPKKQPKLEPTPRKQIRYNICNTAQTVERMQPNKRDYEETMTVFRAAGPGAEASADLTVSKNPLTTGSSFRFMDSQKASPIPAVESMSSDSVTARHTNGLGHRNPFAEDQQQRHPRSTGSFHGEEQCWFEPIEKHKAARYRSEQLLPDAFMGIGCPGSRINLHQTFVVPSESGHQNILSLSNKEVIPIGEQAEKGVAQEPSLTRDVLIDKHSSGDLRQRTPSVGCLCTPSKIKNPNKKQRQSSRSVLPLLRPGAEASPSSSSGNRDLSELLSRSVDDVRGVVCRSGASGIPMAAAIPAPPVPCLQTGCAHVLHMLAPATVCLSTNHSSLQSSVRQPPAHSGPQCSFSFSLSSASSSLASALPCSVRNLGNQSSDITGPEQTARSCPRQASTAGRQKKRIPIKKVSSPVPYPEQTQPTPDRGGDGGSSSSDQPQNIPQDQIPRWALIHSADRKPSAKEGSCSNHPLLKTRAGIHHRPFQASSCPASEKVCDHTEPSPDGRVYKLSPTISTCPATADEEQTLSDLENRVCSGIGLLSSPVTEKEHAPAEKVGDMTLQKDFQLATLSSIPPGDCSSQQGLASSKVCRRIFTKTTAAVMNMSGGSDGEGGVSLKKAASRTGAQAQTLLSTHQCLSDESTQPSAVLRQEQAEGHELRNTVSIDGNAGSHEQSDNRQGTQNQPPTLQEASTATDESLVMHEAEEGSHTQAEMIPPTNTEASKLSHSETAGMSQTNMETSKLSHSETAGMSQTNMEPSKLSHSETAGMSQTNTETSEMPYSETEEMSQTITEISQLSHSETEGMSFTEKTTLAESEETSHRYSSMKERSHTKTEELSPTNTLSEKESHAKTASFLLDTIKEVIALGNSVKENDLDTSLKSSASPNILQTRGASFRTTESEKVAASAAAVAAAAESSYKTVHWDYCPRSVYPESSQCHSLFQSCLDPPALERPQNPAALESKAKPPAFGNSFEPAVSENSLLSKPVRSSLDSTSEHRNEMAMLEENLGSQLKHSQDMRSKEHGVADDEKGNMPVNNKNRLCPTSTTHKSTRPSKSTASGDSRTSTQPPAMTLFPCACTELKMKSKEARFLSHGQPHTHRKSTETSSPKKEQCDAAQRCEGFSENMMNVQPKAAPSKEIDCGKSTASIKNEVGSTKQQSDLPTLAFPGPAEQAYRGSPERDLAKCSAGIIADELGTLKQEPLDFPSLTFPELAEQACSVAREKEHLKVSSIDIFCSGGDGQSGSCDRKQVPSLALSPDPYPQDPMASPPGLLQFLREENTRMSPEQPMEGSRPASNSV